MKIMLLLCAMIVGISNVWATDEEFDFTSMDATEAGEQEFEQGQITVLCSNGIVTTQSSTMQLRWFHYL